MRTRAAGNVEIGQRWKYTSGDRVWIVEVTASPLSEGGTFEVTVVQVLSRYEGWEYSVGRKYNFWFNNPSVWEYLEGQDKPKE